MKLKCLLLIMLVFAMYKNEKIFESNTESEGKHLEEQPTVVKIEEDEYVKKKTSNFIGVSYHKMNSRWIAYRHSKNEKKNVNNGTYRDEETAAHASDTLARKLIANGEKGHELNFPDDHTEVYTEQKTNNFGVSYSERDSIWRVQRRSKNEKKIVYNGSYKDEETAAHASDTLARILIANGEKGHQLNFPDDDTEVYPEQKTNYFGVFYNNRDATWCASRHSKNEKKRLHNGTYKDEEAAAHASDTLARKLMANGEKGHNLNFPDDTEVSTEEVTYPKKKRKRPENFGDSQDSKSHQISKE